ncbi:hypothetical protein M404DRAFT_30229 [Pisolithus tinctorius Marx 270]|uniref:Uncharacterized protein n=1 Tax=Pisolithus tinctorius Marx 270 TaxID=870435 RepID=A0A0C3IS81_PISTI|nr:hypothetical protein M404DRAFT_30229 [Pisolithus tinctorius Marx 270]
MEAYFSLPLETKTKVGSTILASARSSPRPEKLYHEEAVNCKGYAPALDSNIDPVNRGDLHEGFKIAVGIGKVLLYIFALALDLPQAYFAEKTTNSAAIMRALHYPPQTSSDDDLIVGFGASTDFQVGVLEVSDLPNSGLN